MNKIITAFATVLLATAVFAGPGGGRGGHAGHGGGHRSAPTRQAQRAPARSVQRSAPARSTAARPAAHRPAGGHAVAPHRGGHGFGHGIGYRPSPGPRYHHRYWARPPMPPVRPLALYGWTWIASPWTILVNGVYCTGDGYWFDGYNYYYNDCYYTTAPVSVTYW